MYIIGINQGHNATACLLKDGKVMNCVSEERFSRIKNHCGIPRKSIKWILEASGISLKDVDYFVLDNAYPIRDAGFSQPEAIRNSFIHKTKLNKIKTLLANKMPVLYPKLYDAIAKVKSPKKKFREILIREVSKKLDVSREKILLLNHHLLHAFSTCFNLPIDEKTLIFTLDGEGSDLSATVNVWDGKKLKIISQSSKYDSIGYLYSLVTLFLGMKPLEHEFKVMGLAPYAKKNYSEEAYQKLRKLFYIDDHLVIHCKYPAMFLDYYLNREMRFMRFDNIASGVQKIVEELTTEWVKRAIKKTGIRNIALSGGVFMNVKANQKLYELSQVKKMFVMPSCGDESNPIGACFYGYWKYCKEKRILFNPIPLMDLYLGPEYGVKYVESLIKDRSLNKKYKVKKIKNINKEVARLLANGKIVARSSGKSEWGARALGNRSILSSPKNKETIKILNELIKDRDFWMPFTPSILDKFEKEYIANPRNMFSPYMAITFDSTEKAKADLPAAMHPYDFTVRPQVVTKEYNKDYYEIIDEFSKITGIGGILNTSFNLHGEPNVLTPKDALHTFENSGLKFLVIGDYLFEKI
ncbi:MAG: carbamoyltransferase C-terminal domain-containing protein [archaeon]